MALHEIIKMTPIDDICLYLSVIKYTDTDKCVRSYNFL